MITHAFQSVPAVLLSAALLFGCSKPTTPEPTPPPSAYQLPRSLPETADATGWARYVDPVRLTPASAQGVAPGQASPTATAVHFWSSLVRGDARYRDVLASDIPVSVQQRLTAMAFAQVTLRRIRSDDDSATIESLVEVTTRPGQLPELGTQIVRLVRKDDRWFVSNLK